jgi:chorismate mutase
MTIVCRGVRGAITIDNDTREAILEATEDLLVALIEANGIEPEDVASVFFTTTPDIVADYPALAARKLGWIDNALICGHEMSVPHGLKKCIRILIHWNTAKGLKEIQHLYLRDAVNLRPDVALRNLEAQDHTHNGKEE